MGGTLYRAPMERLALIAFDEISGKAYIQSFNANARVLLNL